MGDFGRGMVVGLVASLAVLNLVNLEPKKGGGMSRRLQETHLAREFGLEANRVGLNKERCLAGTGFKGARRVGRTAALASVLETEGWAVNGSEAAHAVLFDHGTPRKKGEALKQSSFAADCEEVNVAALDPGSCLLFAETNSKALPYHAHRYGRSEDDDKWVLKPRSASLVLPTEAETLAARDRVARLLQRFSGLAKTFQPLLAKAAISGEENTGPKRGKFTRRRLQGEGLVLLTSCASVSDLAFVVNLACSIRKVRPAATLVVAVADRHLDHRLQRVDGILVLHAGPFKYTHDHVGGEAHDGGGDEATTSSVLDAAPAGTAERDWLAFAAVYVAHTLGFDVLYSRPDAFWTADALLPLLERREPPLASADAAFATSLDTQDDPDLAPFFALADAAFYRCNWKTELLLDAILHTQDLVLSWGLAPTLNQHLAEAHSLLGLQVQRFDTLSHVALSDPVRGPDDDASPSASLILASPHHDRQLPAHFWHISRDCRVKPQPDRCMRQCLASS